MKYNKKPIVYWNLTNKCNIDPGCIYCFADSTKNSHNPNLTLKEKLSLIDRLKKYGVDYIAFSGGEPTLDKDLPSLINYSKEKEMHTRMISNGTLINEDLAKKLYSCGLESVSINIDSPNKNTHNEIRKNRYNYWEMAVNGASNCKNRGIDTQIAMTVMKRNFHEINDYILFGKKLGVDVEFTNLVPVGRGKELLTELLEKSQIREMFEISAKYSLGEKPKIKVTDSQYYLFLREYYLKHKIDKEVRLGFGCATGMSAIVIKSDLKVTPCLLIPDLIIGDLKKQPLKEIWKNSQSLTELRDRDKLGGKCGKCTNKEKCGGCRAMAYALTGKLMAENPFCIYE
ncbi:MAG: radical SAM protein [Nanoarchaeota archaeon]